MNTQSDFEEFFRLLESNLVEYMIVGGSAVAFHGYPRFTIEHRRFASTRTQTQSVSAASQ